MHHMKIAVKDHIYWTVVGHAATTNQTHGEVLGELLGEALRWRALAADRVPVPVTQLEEAIVEAAGIENMAVEDMRTRILSMGFECYADDVEVNAREAAEKAAA